MQFAPDMAPLLERLATRLERLESRLDSIESRLGMPNTPLPPMAPKPFIHEPSFSSAMVSVSGSSAPASVLSSSRELLLAPVDEEILNFIRSKTHVCASDVRVRFRYKGNNAASARLSRLFELGVLDKQQAGRKVYYSVR